MRTKTLLCAAALAAGVATSMAQSNVYSLNVVGYVNTPLAGSFSYNLISNPLNNTNNNITNLFANLPATQDGSSILRWDPTVSDFKPDSWTYDGAAAVWRKNGGADLTGFTLNPGEGIFYVNTGPNLTNTFVGEVIQAPPGFTNTLVGGFAYNVVGSSAPIGGNFTNSIGGLNPGDGDTILFWNVGITDIDPNYTSYDLAGHVWRDPASNPNPPYNIGVGIGFFYVNQNANNVWVRNFTVQ
jgi:hypothetical protein